MACLLASVLLLPGAAAATKDGALRVPHFVDSARRAGIHHVYDGGSDFIVGGGVAVFDCDDDGVPELYIAGGEGSSALYHNDSDIGGPLRFARITDAATDLHSVTGAYPLDIDADAVVDLVVMRDGEDVLLRGLGQCRFERANEAWSFDGGDARTTAFAAAWLDPSTLPTLVFGTYVELDFEAGTRICAPLSLVRPAASGTGYDLPMALSPGWCPLSMLFSDWDRSGRKDLRVSNDRHYYDGAVGQEQLWRFAPGEEPRLYTQEEGWRRLQVWGMGIASHDVTGDGYPEYFLTSIGPNMLQTLAHGPERAEFLEVARRHGLTATHPTSGDTSLPSTAWHDEFEDVNNDGRIDLFIAKGNVDQVPETAMDDPSALFLGLPDGTFKEKARQAGLVARERGRGAAVVDLNLDGLLDIVQVDRGDPVRIWRNLGSGRASRPRPIGDWVAVRLVQPGTNRDAIGAWVEVRTGDRTQTREVTVGGGHAGGQLGPIHFGLGDAEQAEVRVQWPDGEWGDWLEVNANQYVTIDRGDGQATPWRPSAR